ncbi:MAG: type II toxin-antitoxin system Phd/YefM family antitoxin [Spirochaetaceae bacterium]
MIRKMSISETRRKITSLQEELEYEDTISVTNHGKEVFALIRWDTYESIAETLDIMSDPQAFDELQQGLQQLERGQLLDFDTFVSEQNVYDTTD